MVPLKIPPRTKNASLHYAANIYNFLQHSVYKYIYAMTTAQLPSTDSLSRRTRAWAGWESTVSDWLL